MTREALRVTTTVPVAPTTLYYAWLDGVQHTAMTGSTAKFEAEVGAKFSALDGYVTGQLVALDLGRRIVMSWRTADFPQDAPDSRVEVHFEALGGGTRVLVLHTEIPEGQSETYRGTWNDKYFQPMRVHFSKFLPDPRLPPPVRKPLPPPEPDDDEDDEDDELPRHKLRAKGSSARLSASRLSSSSLSSRNLSSSRLSKPSLSKPSLSKPSLSKPSLSSPSGARAVEKAASPSKKEVAAVKGSKASDTKAKAVASAKPAKATKPAKGSVGAKKVPAKTAKPAKPAKATKPAKTAKPAKATNAKAGKATKTAAKPAKEAKKSVKVAKKPAIVTKKAATKAKSAKKVVKKPSKPAVKPTKKAAKPVKAGKKTAKGAGKKTGKTR